MRKRTVLSLALVLLFMSILQAQGQQCFTSSAFTSYVPSAKTQIRILADKQVAIFGPDSTTTLIVDETNFRPNKILNITYVLDLNYYKSYQRMMILITSGYTLYIRDLYDDSYSREFSLDSTGNIIRVNQQKAMAVLFSRSDYRTRFYVVDLTQPTVSTIYIPHNKYIQDVELKYINGYLYAFSIGTSGDVYITNLDFNTKPQKLASDQAKSLSVDEMKQIVFVHQDNNNQATLNITAYSTSNYIMMDTQLIQKPYQTESKVAIDTSSKQLIVMTNNSILTYSQAYFPINLVATFNISFTPKYTDDSPIIDFQRSLLIYQSPSYRVVVANYKSGYVYLQEQSQESIYSNYANFIQYNQTGGIVYYKAGYDIMRASNELFKSTLVRPSIYSQISSFNFDRNVTWVVGDQNIAILNSYGDVISSLSLSNVSDIQYYDNRYSRMYFLSNKSLWSVDIQANTLYNLQKWSSDNVLNFTKFIVDSENMKIFALYKQVNQALQIQNIDTSNHTIVMKYQDQHASNARLNLSMGDGNSPLIFIRDNQIFLQNRKTNEMYSFKYISYIPQKIYFDNYRSRFLLVQSYVVSEQLQTGEMVSSRNFNNIINAVDYSQSTQQIAVCGKNFLYILNSLNMQTYKVERYSQQPCKNVQFIINSKQVIAQQEDGLYEIYELGTYSNNERIHSFYMPIANKIFLEITSNSTHISIQTDNVLQPMVKFGNYMTSSILCTVDSQLKFDQQQCNSKQSYCPLGTYKQQNSYQDSQCYMCSSSCRTCSKSYYCNTCDQQSKGCTCEYNYKKSSTQGSGMQYDECVQDWNSSSSSSVGRILGIIFGSLAGFLIILGVAGAIIRQKRIKAGQTAQLKLAGDNISIQPLLVNNNDTTNLTSMKVDVSPVKPKVIPINTNVQPINPTQVQPINPIYPTNVNPVVPNTNQYGQQPPINVSPINNQETANNGYQYPPVNYGYNTTGQTQNTGFSNGPQQHYNQGYSANNPQPVYGQNPVYPNIGQNQGYPNNMNPTWNQGTGNGGHNPYA